MEFGHVNTEPNTGRPSKIFWIFTICVNSFHIETTGKILSSAKRDVTILKKNTLNFVPCFDVSFGLGLKLVCQIRKKN